MKPWIAALGAAAMTASLFALAAEPSRAQEQRRLGVLSCDVEGGLGLLIGSSRVAACTFEHSDGGSEEYLGKLSKLGLDVGIDEGSYIRWVVFVPAGTEIGEYALEGTYLGASAGAAVGVGLGANALVGGQFKKIGLQPLSVEGKSGINVAIGLSRLTLEADRDA